MIVWTTPPTVPSRTHTPPPPPFFPPPAAISYADTMGMDPEDAAAIMAAMNEQLIEKQIHKDFFNGPSVFARKQKGRGGGSVHNTDLIC